ncbi:MAG: hypothetical protein ACOYLX_09510 [Burkholderiaceae bacterium]|jgi:hypothetical protein
MPNDDLKRSSVLGTLAIACGALLVFATYWVTGPGIGEFNRFNEQVFGPLYTAGAILMIGVYASAFLVLAAGAAVATVLAWVRGESPRWVSWLATAVTLAAPLIAMNFLKGA